MNPFVETVEKAVYDINKALKEERYTKRDLEFLEQIFCIFLRDTRKVLEKIQKEEIEQVFKEEV